MVIHSDDGYGQPLALGFRRGAGRLGIAATYHPVSNVGQAVAAAQRAAGSLERTAIVLGMLETAAVPVLRVLKRADVPGPFPGDGILRLQRVRPALRGGAGGAGQSWLLH